MKDSVKSIIKMVLEQFQLITTILLAIFGTLQLIAHLSSDLNQGLSWTFPLEVLAVSFPTALCSCVYISNHELTRKEFFIRCLIHFVLLVSVVLGEGLLFRWIGTIEDLLCVLFIFFIIYVSVWIVTEVRDRKSSDSINKALHNVKEKENKKE